MTWLYDPSLIRFYNIEYQTWKSSIWIVKSQPHWFSSDIWEEVVEAASMHFSVHKQLTTMFMVLSISSMQVWHGTIHSKLNFICLLIIMYVPNFKYILLEVCCWMVGRFYRKTILFKDECGSGLHDFYWGWLPHKTMVLPFLLVFWIWRGDMHVDIQFSWHFLEQIPSSLLINP